nr:unnamed protein product [Spirometra erinaceieuropaei]
MRTDPVTNILENCKVKFSVRMEAKGGKSFHKIGYVTVNLSCFAASGNVRCRRRYILEGYEEKRKRQDNSLLMVSFTCRQVFGNTCFRVPPEDMSNCVSNPQATVPSLPTMTEDGVTIFHLSSTSPPAFLTELSRFSENANRNTAPTLTAMASDAAAASSPFLPHHLSSYVNDSSLSRHPRLRDQVGETAADSEGNEQWPEGQEESTETTVVGTAAAERTKLCPSSPSSPTLSLLYGNTSNSNLGVTDWSLPAAFRGQKKTRLPFLTDVADTTRPAHPNYTNLTAPSSPDHHVDHRTSAHVDGGHRFYTGNSIEDLRSSGYGDLSQTSPNGVSGCQLRSPSEYVSPAALSSISPDYSLLETPATGMPFATPEAGPQSGLGQHCVARQQSAETRSEILSYKSPRSETPPAKMSQPALPPVYTHRSADPSTPRSAALSVSASTTTSGQSPLLPDEMVLLKSSPRAEELQQQSQENEDVFFAFDMHLQPPPTSYFDSLPCSRSAALQASLYRPRTHPALTNVVATSSGLLQTEASHLRMATSGPQRGQLHTCPRVRRCALGAAHPVSVSHRPSAILQLSATGATDGGGVLGDSQMDADGGGVSTVSAAREPSTTSSRDATRGFSGSVSSGFQSHSLNSSLESAAVATSGDGNGLLNAPVSRSPEEPADAQSDWIPSEVAVREAKQQHIDSTRTPHDDVVNKILRSRSVIPDIASPQADPVPL